MAQEFVSPILAPSFGSSMGRVTTPAHLASPVQFAQPVQMAATQLAQPVLTQVQAVPAPPARTILGIPTQKLMFFQRPQRVVTVTPPPQQQMVVQQQPPRMVQSQQPPVRNIYRERPVEKTYLSAEAAKPRGCREVRSRSLEIEKNRNSFRFF